MPAPHLDIINPLTTLCLDLIIINHNTNIRSFYIISCLFIIVECLSESCELFGHKTYTTTSAKYNQLILTNALLSSIQSLPANTRYSKEADDSDGEIKLLYLLESSLTWIFRVILPWLIAFSKTDRPSFSVILEEG